MTALLALLVACGGPPKVPEEGALPGDTSPVTSDSGDTSHPAADDLDQDGSPAGEDCDDADAAVHPDAAELCNGVDDDCDGEVDGVSAQDARTWYPDEDDDVYGDTNRPVLSCSQPPGHILVPGDCDDADPSVNPGARETCDGVDTNCSGSEDDAEDAGAWVLDRDEDGFGAWGLACDAPAVEPPNADDCDDARADVHPGAEETCDGQDEDCDGRVDDDAVDRVSWYPDADGDGLGAEDGALEACADPGGYVATGTDCDDTTPGIGERSWYADTDGDGFGVGAPVVVCEAPAGHGRFGGDCDDGDPAVNPGAIEACTATRDLNCDGSVGATDADGDGAIACEDCDDGDATWVVSTWYADADGDGFGWADEASTGCFPSEEEVADGHDCDDADHRIHPGAPEVWYDDVDQACDGGSDWDADADGYDAPEDCDDTRDDVNPGAIEVCNDGVDDDCDGGGGACVLSGGVGLGDADARYLGTGESDDAGKALVGYQDATSATGRSLAIGANGYMSGYGAVFLDRTPDLGDEALSGADAVLYGESPGDAAGTSLAVAGDLDGDGIPDLLVGALHESTHAPSAGAVYVVSGDAVGSASLATASAKLLGDGSGDWTGLVVDGPGDVDSDGVADLYVAAMLNDAGGTDAGAVYYQRGPVRGTYLLTNADGIIMGAAEGDYVGTHVASGDMDGDGVSDPIVVQGGGGNGVYVFAGPPLGVLRPSDACARVMATAEQVSIGSAVDAGPDVDGDGYADLLIGATGDSTNAYASGAAFLVLGPLTGDTDTDAAAVWATFGSTWLGAVGFDVSFAGDVDGDGTEDLLVGSYDGDGGDPGEAALFYGPHAGSGAFEAADVFFTGELADDRAGYAVAGVGDVDNDGFADVAIGAPFMTDVWLYQGAAYLFLGGGM